MAFLAALPEVAEAGGAEAEGGGMLGRAGDLFGKPGAPGAGEQGKQQNSGASRNLNFQAGALSFMRAGSQIRSALRGGPVG